MRSFVGGVLVITMALLVSCARDEVAVDSTGTIAPTDLADSTSSIATTTTVEADVPLPTGVLFAVPTQNREDPAKGQFQVQLHNDTDDRFDLTAIQFRWVGYTTPVVERTAVIVGGQTVDLPVPFPGATCEGDGTLATVPPLDGATVVLRLSDGSETSIRVVDQFHLARRLYLEDCERQMIDTQVAIEWANLREEEFEGRPVTTGALRLTRREGAGTITVQSVSNTIPYEFAAVDTGVDEPVAVLADGDAEVSVPVRFLESRCDPHALAEVKQPTKFIAQIVLGDGSQHPYIVYPERSYWNAMRATADVACVMLGEIEFVGQS